MESNQLSVCQADKGGAILPVHPDFLTKKVKEKLLDPQLYEEFTSDIRPQLYNQLIALWKQGIESDFVSSIEAKKVVGQYRT